MTTSKCSDYKQLGYECVPYYQCSNNGTFITDGGGTTVECPGLLDVCCRNPDPPKVKQKIFQMLKICQYVAQVQ